jgi:DNA-binding MarR family transcriptional regulator
VSARSVSAADVGQQYLELHHQLHRLVDDAMCGAGLSLARWKVMMKLDQHGEMNQSALAGLLGFAPRSITEAVDALERDGLVTRTQCENDRRARIVALTDAGRDAYEATHAVRIKVMDQIFGSLSPSERATLSDLLGTIRTNLPSGESQ